MEIHNIPIDGGVKVVPMSDVDMTSSVDLRKVLQKLVRQKPKKLIVSLENVEYIDSSGLATLIECMQECLKYKGSFRLVISNSKIMEVFRLARLDRNVFQIYKSNEEAEK